MITAPSSFFTGTTSTTQRKLEAANTISRVVTEGIPSGSDLAREGLSEGQVKGIYWREEAWTVIRTTGQRVGESTQQMPCPQGRGGESS
jgi:hypothetical protein